jgi:sphinganine-1-phosphate aldolase
MQSFAENLVYSLAPKAILDKELSKIVKEMEGDVIAMKKRRDDPASFAVLPAKGLDKEKLLEIITSVSKLDTDIYAGKAFGYAYYHDAAHAQLLLDVYKIFANTNPLNPGMFPSLQKFESEVCAMTAHLLGGKRGEACGNITSGGSESILLAIKANKDYFMRRRNIKGRPNIVCPQSAHASANKAGDYFGLDVIRVAVDEKTLRADVSKIRAAINSNTVMIYSSAPSFAQGIIDPIEDLSALALEFGVGLHVDMCLGGFVLPFMEKLGHKLPVYDFRNAGVTSISADVHKYGMGPKGSSCVLFSNREIRKMMYFSCATYTGGLYCSPTIAGTRPGGAIAGAWAAMISLGEEGYMEGVRKMVEATQRMKQKLSKIEGVRVLAMEGVDIPWLAFTTDAYIYRIGECLTSKHGYHMDQTSNPESLHLSITLNHTPDVVDAFVAAVAETVAEVRADPEKWNRGDAKTFEAGSRMQGDNMKIIEGLLIEYLDKVHMNY